MRRLGATIRSMPLFDPVRVSHAAIRRGARLPLRDKVERFIQLAELKETLDALRVDCVLDVGANQGQFARHLRAVGYNGAIVSFEPSAADYAVLAQAAADDPGWFTYALALGAQDGELPFNVTANSVFNSFLSPLEERVDREETVRVARLDGLFGEIRERTAASRVLLKADTQGYDLEVMAGAETVLQHVVALQSEVSVIPIYERMPHYLDALRRYEELGFTLKSLHVVNRDHRGLVIEYDCLMVRA